MGIDRHGARFCCWLRRRGVSFERVLTLGRLGLHLSRADLQRVLRKFGFPSAPSDVARLFEEAGGFAEPVFRLLGAREIVSLDASPFEGATWQHDLNQPIPDECKNRFTTVFDGGTLEHVFDYPRALRNAMDMVAPGGHFLAVNPANNFMGHGFYQFSPELFFRVFHEKNGFLLNAVFVYEVRREKWYRIADPALVGGRVRVVSPHPTSLAVWATKTGQRTTIDLQAQQSDYVDRWQRSNGEGAGDKICRHVRAYNRPWYKTLLRYAEKCFKRRFPRKHFQPFED